MFKEAVHRAAGGATVKYPIAQFQRITYKPGGGIVATAALFPKPGLIVRLCKQHIIDTIDLVSCEVMVVEKPAEIVLVVPSMQLATGNTQKLAGKVTGMSMTACTTIVPQPVQVHTGSVDRRHHQHCPKQQDARYQADPHGKRCGYGYSLWIGAFERLLMYRCGFKMCRWQCTHTGHRLPY